MNFQCLNVKGYVVLNLIDLWCELLDEEGKVAFAVLKGFIEDLNFCFY